MISCKMIIAALALTTALLAAPAAQAHTAGKTHATKTALVAKSPAKAGVKHAKTTAVKVVTKTKTSARSPAKSITRTVKKVSPAKTAAKATH